ncbi:hypothetical protein THRCLA_00207 [Thraustotheca clavata]|uniref:Uncharacterized protein n=1 Tax=Thraustotheca clavata TaxID=74557 RepID=A0A1W0AC74_9STRA|nr:hypothetical protein THRCLA_00207 [Thraustotheca clavata]
MKARALDSKYNFSAKFDKFLLLCAQVLGICVICLVAVDATANNWAINDFVGNAYEFITPIVEIDTIDKLTSHFTFATGLSVSDLSNIGRWMTDYCLTSVADSNKIYLLSGGAYTVDERLNLCDIFRGSYSVDIDTYRTIRFGVAVDGITYLRGNALTHVFTDDATTNLARSGMTHDQLDALGYSPARIQTDIRMTHRVTISNMTTQQQILVPYWRLYSKSYCTGCTPIAELGHGVCTWTAIYSYSTKTLTVSNSTFVAGSIHRLGLMIQQNAFSSASHYIKFVAIILAIGGYLASRRTVQWMEVDPTKTTTILSRVIQIVVPSCFPHPSHALRFDMFCYNSDIFVVLICTSVILDMSHSLIYIREVNVFNSINTDFLMSIQLFALSTRLIWINCGILKLAKLIWNILGTASCCGGSKVMGFLNLKTVTSLYLSAIVIFNVPPYIEYNNSVRYDVKNYLLGLEGIQVNFMNSFYFRGTAAICTGLIVNILLVTLLDQGFNRHFWQNMAKNSLARQAMFNSTSIMCDYIMDIEVNSTSNHVLIICKARRLSTLQWFFMNHLYSFGLPEHDLKQMKDHLKSTHATESPQGTGDNLFMVIQDGGHHLHLLDDQLNDVKSLMYNIKVLKDTTVTIK